MIEQSSIETVARSQARQFVDFLGASFKNINLNTQFHLKSRKIDRALEYISLWNTSEIISLHQVVLNEFNTLGLAPDIHATIAEILSGDVKTKESMILGLNILESIAISIENDLANEEILYQFFNIIIIRWYKFFRLWINKERNNSKRFQLYQNLEKLYEKWEY